MANLAHSNISKIQNAFDLFNQGQTDNALTICKKILNKHPNDVNALNLSAIIKDAQGHKQEAIKFFLKASKLDPKNSKTLTNLGITYFEIKDLGKSRDTLEKALSINPNEPEALFNLANIYFLENQQDDAIQYYQRTIQTNPLHFKAYNNLGKIYQEKNDTEKAKFNYNQAISINPNFIEALTGFTREAYRENDYSAAINCCDKILTLEPENYEILFLKGEILVHDGLMIEAKPYLEKALSINDSDPLLHRFYGTLLDNLEEQSPQATEHLIRAFEIDPTNAELASDIGKTCITNGYFDQAEKYFKVSLSLDPNNCKTLNALGTVFQERKNYSDAIDMYKRSIGIEKSYAPAYINMGNICREQHDIAAAKRYLQQAISYDGEDINAKRNMSLFELISMDFKNGWSNYRYRPSVEKNGAHFAEIKLPPVLDKKNILFIKDQGIGDELFFFRFLTLVQKRGASISYVCSEKLIPILSPLNLVDRFYTDIPDPSDFDYNFSIGDLPFILDLQSPSDIPPPVLLPVGREKKANVLDLLQSFGPPPYIAVTWRAGAMINSKRLDAYLKEIDLKSLSKIINKIGGTVVAIQKNVPHKELDLLSQLINRPILDTALYHDDLERMLALLDIVDHYITVSNTNVHLRESLGKESRVFVCSPPEWRWLEEGKSSPWFPSSKIYRQTKDGSWEIALNELVQDLEMVTQ